MQAVSKGLEKVEQELAAADRDGAISVGFQKVSMPFRLGPGIYLFLEYQTE